MRKSFKKYFIRERCTAAFTQKICEIFPRKKFRKAQQTPRGEYLGGFLLSVETILICDETYSLQLKFAKLRYPSITEP
jgi:hypothetical protein